MDKRSLLFLFALIVSFLLIQNFFAPDPADTKIDQETVQTEAVQTGVVTKRAIKKEALPLVKCFLSNEGKELITWAYSVNNGYIMLAWEDNIPETLYVQDNGAMKKVSLYKTPEKAGVPVVYSGKITPSITTTTPPSLGRVDIQLLSLPESASPIITFAELVNGKIAFPNSKLYTNALALMKVGSRYNVVGVYDANDDSFISLADASDLKPLLKMQAIPAKATSTKTAQAEYFILENEFAQFVFSSVGGSISEINLPFKSDEDHQSVVLPIEIDHEMNTEHPSNAMFPLHTARTANGKKEPTLGGYYPLLRRGIVSPDPKYSVTTPPSYMAMNIVSDHPDTAKTRYRMTNLTKTSITFEGRDSGRRITKTFSLPASNINAPYCLDVELRVDGDARGLYLVTGVPEVEMISGNPTPQLLYRTSNGNASKVDKLSLPKKEPSMTSSARPDWVCTSNGFFGLILTPTNHTASGFKTEVVPGYQDPTRLSILGVDNDQYPAEKYPGYTVALPITSDHKTLNYRLVAGPLDATLLKQLDTTFTNPETGENPGYSGAKSYHGWFAFISEPFAKFLWIVMQFFHNVTGSWGISIILLTVVLRIMLFPLNKWSIKSMVRMQEVGPRVKEIQDKHKKDPKKAQMEVMALYKEKGVNPLSGCLPLLIQMPFLFGMFDLLKSSFALRGASFIPGWIDNLTSPDVLFSWGYSVPFFGTSLHLLPILLGVVMFFQQKLSSGRVTENATDQQKQQQKMGKIMTIVFTVIFYHFPSGLNLYWLSSMGLAALQQYYMQKKMKADTTDSTTIAVTPKKKK